MPKTKISEFSSTPANNTDIDSINIAEGCAPSGINDAIRELMAQLKDFQVGSAGDPVTVGGVLTVQAGAVGTPAITTAGDTNTGIFFPAADTIAFAEGGVEAARFDSSGNLGLGVTPSAWQTGGDTKALQMNGGSLWSFSTSQFNILQNAYYNNSGSFIYTNTAAASAYRQISGAHSWYTAASGTAGNAITFTQAMTLDASGNLGVGTTSQTARLESFRSDGGLIMRLSRSSTDRLDFYAGSGVSYIDSSPAGGQLAFATVGTERARIDSSGNLLVGTTNGGGLFAAYSSSTGGTVVDVRNTAASGNCVILYPRMTQTGTTSNYLFAGQANGSDRVYIYGNGNIVNSNNSYGSLSDAKLKENITDATPKLAGLMQVRVVNYNLKTEPENKQLGVIAQELEQIFPSMIDESPDRDAEGNDLGTTTKSVKYSVFVPMLIKAIQELKAEFDAYKASHP